MVKASSSNGRAADSKSACWGFESLLACQAAAQKFKNRKIWEFDEKCCPILREVRVELSRIEWPSTQEWIGATIIVLVVVAAFAVFLALLIGLFLLLLQKNFFTAEIEAYYNETLVCPFNVFAVTKMLLKLT